MLRGDETTVFQKLIVESCFRCGVLFGLNDSHQSDLRRTGESFYCPNGHRQHYTNSQQVRIDRLNARVASLTERADHYERSRNALRGVVTRTKKAIHAGQCPYCAKTYKRLKHHMESKHADELKTVE